MQEKILTDPFYFILVRNDGTSVVAVRLAVLNVDFFGSLFLTNCKFCTFYSISGADGFDFTNVRTMYCHSNKH